MKNKSSALRTLFAFIPAVALTATVLLLSNCNGGGSKTAITPAESTIKIYPNPASDHLTVETSQDVKNGIVEIYNINGQKMSEQVITDNNTTLNTSNLSTAVYIIKTLSENKTIDVRKITISRN